MKAGCAAAAAAMLCGGAHLGGFGHFAGGEQRRAPLGLLWVCLNPDSDFKKKDQEKLGRGEELHFSLSTQCVTLTPCHCALIQHSYRIINDF